MLYVKPLMLYGSTYPPSLTHTLSLSLSLPLALYLYHSSQLSATNNIRKKKNTISQLTTSQPATVPQFKVDSQPDRLSDLSQFAASQPAMRISQRTVSQPLCLHPWPRQPFS